MEEKTTGKGQLGQAGVAWVQIQVIWSIHFPLTWSIGGGFIHIIKILTMDPWSLQRWSTNLTCSLFFNCVVEKTWKKSVVNIMLTSD